MKMVKGRVPDWGVCPWGVRRHRASLSFRGQGQVTNQNTWEGHRGSAWLERINVSEAYFQQRFCCPLPSSRAMLCQPCVPEGSHFWVHLLEMGLQSSELPTWVNIYLLLLTLQAKCWTPGPRNILFFHHRQLFARPVSADRKVSRPLCILAVTTQGFQTSHQPRGLFLFHRILYYL